ncbi:MAG: flavodoxin family protein [Chloroflexi bacterium]|nr:flavodoxin family protein [Chloroflexota bacterium]
MKILAIVGSPRPGGNTSYLVDQALKEAATHGFETEKIILTKYRVSPCDGHENCASFSACKHDDDAPMILDKFISADGIILGSPVYYYNMTAQMKAFVDRNYFLYTHEISPKMFCAGLIVIGGGAGLEHTVRALRRFVKLSADIPDDRIVTVTGYASKPGEVKSSPSLIEEARKLGGRLAEILTSAHSPKSV